MSLSPASRSLSVTDVAQSACDLVTVSGVRDHVLVLPSVICTTVVARRVAARTGAVVLSHQDGCGHIGDDVGHSLELLAALATNPNVAATLVLSLGCETVQGASLAERISLRGGQVELLRLQDYGASGTEEVAVERVNSLRTLGSEQPTSVVPSHLHVGILVDRRDDLVKQFVRSCVERASVVVAGRELSEVDCAVVTTSTGSAANAMQRLALLAAAGVQAIIAFPGRDDPPQSIAVCPTISVASTSGLHSDLDEDFDLSSEAQVDTIWSLLTEVTSGQQTTAERLGLDDFSLPRLRRTM